MKELDLRGLSCPKPVVQTRKALQEGAQELKVIVDDSAAVGNVSRMARSMGCEVQVEETGGIFELQIRSLGEPQGTGAVEVESAPTFVLSTNYEGEKDGGLGKIFIKNFLSTLAEVENPPRKLLLFNTGAKLAVEGEETVPALESLEQAGVEILVCGNCLDFFGLKEKLAVGQVSNMYEIIQAMMEAANTVNI